MKEIVVISGKGGTGKTSITAAFARLMDKKVLADCDVDAADLDLILNSEKITSNIFSGGKKAEIISDKCTGCGKCLEVCEFNAVSRVDDKYVIDEFGCEGCGACFYFCTDKAVRFEETKSGDYFTANSDFGPLVYARLEPGEENSGKLVITVKNTAKKIAIEKGLDKILIDGSPGTGCPVIATISGSDYVIVVTEPSMSGIHDMKRVLELIKRFDIKCGVIVNKFDINKEHTEGIECFLKDNNIQLLGKIPFDSTITRAMVEGKNVIDFDVDSLVSKAILNIWEKIRLNID